MYISSSEKKFFMKGTCFAILLVLVLNILNWCYMKKNVCDNDRTAKFENIEPGIIISNTGSSHGLYGFNYEKLEKEYNCFNFALESQKLSYDYRIISNYSNNLENGGIMFITVSFFSIYGMDEMEQEGFEEKNRRYYKILPPRLIKGYNWKEDIKQHILPIINDEELLRTFVEGKETSDTWQNVWYLNAAEADDLANDAEKAYERHYVENGDIIRTKKINEEEYEALTNLILLCKYKNIRSIIITTPVMPEYKEKIEQSFLDDFYKRMEDITKKYSIEYYDYSGDVRFAQQPQLFMNVDHLNYYGALKFTDILKEEIINQKLNNCL